MSNIGTDTPMLIKLITLINKEGLNATCIKETMTKATLEISDTHINMPYELNKWDFIKNDKLSLNYTQLVKRIISDYEAYRKIILKLKLD